MKKLIAVLGLLSLFILVHFHDEGKIKNLRPEAQTSVRRYANSFAYLNIGDFVIIGKDTYVVSSMPAQYTLNLEGPGPSSSSQFGQKTIHGGIRGALREVSTNSVTFCMKGDPGYDATATWFWLQ
jgi:hypothetical protein